jgi:hypothetical protein
MAMGILLAFAPLIVYVIIGRLAGITPDCEQVPENLWTSPEFIRTNYIITAVWALAFALMVVVDIAMLYLPNLPTRLAIIVTIAVIWGAAKFTSWYPDRKRRAG